MTVALGDRTRSVPRSRVTSVPPAVRLVILSGFVIAVVATPPAAFWAFAVHAALVVTVAVILGVDRSTFATRMTLELPFVVFALALPFFGGDPVTQRWGLTWSVAGSWAAWNIIAKATLGTAAAVLLGVTTPPGDVLEGLERLRTPSVLVAIAGFMLRYLHVVADDLRRMDTARLARGGAPGSLARSRMSAATVGTVFIRTYERGERVHHAMLARGHDGTFHPTTPKTRLTWFPASWPVVVAVAVCVAAHVWSP